MDSPCAHEWMATADAGAATCVRCGQIHIEEPGIYELVTDPFDTQAGDRANCSGLRADLSRMVRTSYAQAEMIGALEQQVIDLLTRRDQLQAHIDDLHERVDWLESSVWNRLIRAVRGRREPVSIEAWIIDQTRGQR